MSSYLFTYETWIEAPSEEEALELFKKDMKKPNDSQIDIKEELEELL